jgi:PAS domain S-box-containing protein
VSIPPEDWRAIFASTGETGRLIAKFDWLSTSVGALDQWPHSLRTTVSILLRSPVPIVLLWGAEGVMLYNDAYSAFAGDRHPKLLGSKVREGWPEVADFNDNVMKVGLAGGALQYKDQELTLYRFGRPEQVWMNLDYSPVLDDAGLPAGVICILAETTERVAAEQMRMTAETRLRDSEARLAFLDVLGAETAALSDADAVLATTTRLLGEHLNISVCAYADMDEDGDGFTIRGDWAAPGSTSIVGHYSLADFGVLAVETLGAGLPLVLNDNVRELAPEEAATFQRRGIAATICMPLVKEGRLTALMAIHDRTPRNWSDAELSLLREVTARSWAHVERVASVAALASSEERMRLAVDNAEIGFWDVDLLNDKLIWPPRTKAMFGISADVPVTLKDFYDGLHPDDRAATSEAFTAAADPARRALYDVEYRTVGAEDGVVRWVAAKGRGLFDETGRCLRVAGTVIDISARKAAEGSLREIEARFRNMADHAPVMMWVTDEEGRCTYLNRSWYDFTGQLAEQGEGAGWLDAVHPDDRAQAAEIFTAANIGHEPFRLEFRLRRKDDEYRWVIDAASPRFGRDGEFLGYIGSVVDIQERKAAEDVLERRVAEALAERQKADALYRTYFENTPEALFVIKVETDGGFSVEEINPAHEAGVGFKLDDIRGKRIEKILPEPTAERVLETYRRVAETGAIHQYREEFDLRGDPQHWDTSIVPMRDQDGRVVRLIGSSRNVTRQVIAEEALRQSQKMEAMGQLTGGVAHDFNNLLTPIIGSLDMLVRREVGSERERRLIEGALQSAERAKTLVQRLLAFARRQPLQPVSVNLSQLVESMVGLIDSTLGPTIDVRVHVSPDLSPAKADPNQLEMALLNLAVNARDAMPEGGQFVIKATEQIVHRGHHPGLPQGSYVRLCVSDNGTGMEPDTVQRAIEPFFSTKGVGRGTGLGLSMVHGLAAQLGGALTIESALGVGTTVALWLPISPAAADTDGTTNSAPAARTGRGVALLVDDEDLVRMSTADMLMDLGFEVVEASSAEAALRVLKGGMMPDILITDHLMPGMSGADLARQARSLAPALPVLIVSGYAEVDGLAPDLLRLTKPFRNAELAVCISTLLPQSA